MDWLNRELRWSKESIRLVRLFPRKRSGFFDMARNWSLSFPRYATDLPMRRNCCFLGLNWRYYSLQPGVGVIRDVPQMWPREWATLAYIPVHCPNNLPSCDPSLSLSDKHTLISLLKDEGFCLEQEIYNVATDGFTRYAYTVPIAESGNSAFGLGSNTVRNQNYHEQAIKVDE